METNEIEKNTITAENTENAQIKENSQPSVQQAEQVNENTVSQDTNNINMQKTQRVNILKELIQDTEKTQQKNTEDKLNGKSTNQTGRSNNNLKKEDVEDKGAEQGSKDYKLEQMLLNRINIMQGKITDSLKLIEKFEKINTKEGNMPNIVTTLRDKLTQEVIKQFNTVGIKFNMKSYLVQAVVSDLLGIFEEGITQFKECSENLDFVSKVQEDFEYRVALAPTSKVKNYFARLRGIIRPEIKQEKLYELERERQEKKLEQANICLIKYKYKNSELANYTIRKNIVSSLTKEMMQGKGPNISVPVNEFIDKRITPDLKKLGLQYLSEPLEESLYKAYSEDHKVESKEAFMQLPMNVLRDRPIKDEFETARQKIVMVTQNKTAEATDDREAI